MSFAKKNPFVRRRANGTARIQAESYGSFEQWNRFTQQIAQRDQKCVFCGSPDAREAHHIFGLARGATTSKANVAYVCRSCHDKRTRHTIPRDNDRKGSFKKLTFAQKAQKRIR